MLYDLLYRKRTSLRPRITRHFQTGLTLKDSKIVLQTTEHNDFHFSETDVYTTSTDRWFKMDSERRHKKFSTWITPSIPKLVEIRELWTSH